MSDSRLGIAQIARQSLRMTARDWRAGELTMLILALALAVAALASVGFLGDRMRQGLERDGAADDWLRISLFALIIRSIPRSPPKRHNSSSRPRPPRSSPA